MRLLLCFILFYFLYFVYVQETCLDPVLPMFGMFDLECNNHRNSTTCCNYLFDQVISNHSTSLTLSISSIISLPMSSCRSNLENIICDFCDIDNNPWINMNETSNTYSIYICQSYCDNLFNLCNGQTNNNSISVYNQFNTTNEFCFSLFNTSLIDLYIVDSYDCINNIPECTQENYFSNFTECIDGSRSLIWYKTNELCISGVDKPDNIYNLPCGDHCGPGLYFNINTMNCDYAPQGYYSFGNGIQISTWSNELNSSFLNDGWILSDNFIQSGYNTTTLTFSSDFLTNGSISFAYSVNSFGDVKSKFSIYFDGDLLDSFTNTKSQYIQYSLPVPIGYHYLKFEYKAGNIGNSFNEFRGVRIKEFTTLGTIRALSSPIICNPGTYSYEEGSTYCDICDWNTFSDEGAILCIDCPQNEYSFPGSSNCIPMDSCGNSDYTIIYEECNNGKQNGYHVLKEGIYCLEYNPPQNISVNCFSCELGLYRNDETYSCDNCNVGYFWNENTNECEKSKRGYAAILYKSYFKYPMVGNIFPNEFTSGCSGNCLESPTWQFTSTKATTGVSNGNNIDLFLKLSLQIVNNGNITFSYTNYGDMDNGLQFFINDKEQHIIYNSHELTTVTYSITSGYTEFYWNYHQEINTIGGVELGPIIIEGFGSATEDYSSPPGMYSNGKSGTTSFIPCEPGSYKSSNNETCNNCIEDYFTDIEGSTECINCGLNTISNRDKTDCIADLPIHVNHHLYNLDNLPDSLGPLIIPNSNEQLYINLLTKNTFNEKCLDEYGEEISSYLCKSDIHDNGEDIGNYMNIEEIILSDDENDTGLLFTYSMIHSKSECYTSLLITCDNSTDTSIPFFIENPSIDKSNCEYSLRWDTIYGCYECTEPTTIVIQRTGCIDGEETYQSVKIGNCGLYSMDDITIGVESCTKELEISYFTLIMIVIAFIILLICVGSLFIGTLFFHVNLRNQYTALLSKNEDGTYEMEEVSIELEEDTEI